MNVIAFAKEHPVEVGAGIFVGGFALIYLLRALSGGSSNAAAQGNAQAAFLAAQSAQAQSGNALAAAENTNQAQTAQTLIGANASVINNQTWATAQQQGNTVNAQIAQTNANAAVAMAPYSVSSQLISALGSVASLPGSTVTSTSSDSGFFGLGASSSSSSSYVPNPSATAAGSTLGALAGNLSSGGAFQTGTYTSH